MVTLFFLFKASPDIGLSPLILAIVNGFLIWWLVKHNLQTRTDLNHAEDHVSGIIADSMINYETVKFFAGENKERRRLSAQFDDWTQKLWRFSNSFRLMDIAIGTTSGIAMLFMLWLAIQKLNHGFTLGDLVMVTGFITSFYYEFLGSFRVRDIAKSITDLEKYFDILDQDIQVKDPLSPQTITNPQGYLSFKISLYLSPGQKQSHPRHQFGHSSRRTSRLCWSFRCR